MTADQAHVEALYDALHHYEHGEACVCRATATVAVETLTPLIRAQVAAEVRAAEVLSPFSPIGDPAVRAYNLGARQALDTAARIAEGTP